MVSAIGPFPTFSSATGSAASTAGIEAQIARDQKELANCVNCASAETKQGQADIQALSNKISVAKARLEQIANVSPADPAAALSPATASEAAVSETAARDTATNEPVVNSNAVATIAEGNANSTTTLNTSGSGAGSIVNEYV